MKTATRDGIVTLMQNVPADTLAARFEGTIASIWQYGVGDTVEVPVVIASPIQ